MKYQRGLVGVLLPLGRIFIEAGDALLAKAQFEEGLAMCKQMKLVQQQAVCLAGFAGLAGLAEKMHAPRVCLALSRLCASYRTGR